MAYHAVHYDELDVVLLRDFGEVLYEEYLVVAVVGAGDEYVVEDLLRVVAPGLGYLDHTLRDEGALGVDDADASTEAALLHGPLCQHGESVAYLGLA